MTNLSLAKEYYDNLNALVAGIRRDLDLPDLPVFIGCSVSEESLNNMDTLLATGSSSFLLQAAKGISVSVVIRCKYIVQSFFLLYRVIGL